MKKAVKIDLTEFAGNWIDDWNSHDLDRILSHYSEDVEVTTPMIRTTIGLGSGSLKGKKAVASYWRTALGNLPDLRFELIEVTGGIDSVAIYYKSIHGKRAIEVMFINNQGKVYRMFAFYTT